MSSENCNHSSPILPWVVWEHFQMRIRPWVPSSSLSHHHHDLSFTPLLNGCLHSWEDTLFVIWVYGWWPLPYRPFEFDICNKFMIFVLFTRVIAIHGTRLHLFSRVLRDSMTCCVGRSVGRSVRPSALAFFGVYGRFLRYCSCPIT